MDSAQQVFKNNVIQERARIVDKVIFKLLLHTEYTISQLQGLSFTDGREYIIAPNGMGYRIDMNYGPEDNFKLTIEAVPVIMSKEDIPYEGSK